MTDFERGYHNFAKNADGFCTFETPGDTFVATITLPYPLREGDAQCIHLQK